MKKQTQTSITLLPDGQLSVTFPYNAEVVARIRALPDRKWNPSNRQWEVGIANLPEIASALRIDMSDLDKQVRRAYQIHRIRHARARIVADNVNASLTGVSLPLAKIDNATSMQVPGYKFMTQFKQGTWDGKRHLFNRQTKNFPAGLVQRVGKILREHGTDFELELLEEPPVQKLGRANRKGPATALRDYQEECLARALKEKRGIIEIATGGGKTLLAAHIIHHLSRHCMFLVHTRDLLHQTIEMFRQELRIPIGCAGDGVIDLKPVTVGTVQTCARAFDLKLDTCPDGETLPKDSQVSDDQVQQLRSYLEAVPVAIFDECHHLPTETTYGLASEMKGAHWRFGLSATPYRADRMDMLIEAALGPKIYSARASALIEQGYLVSPIIRIMPVAPLVVRNGTPTYNDIYSMYVVENRRRNKMIVDQVKKQVKAGKSVLVLVTQVRHGQILCEMLTEAPLLQGYTPTQERQGILDGLRDKSIPVVVATTIADEGINVPTLDCVVVAGAGRSPTRVLQRIGRALRIAPEKEYAMVIDFLDDAPYLREHAADRLELYKTEARFILET